MFILVLLLLEGRASRGHLGPSRLWSLPTVTLIPEFAWERGEAGGWVRWDLASTSCCQNALRVFT